MTHRNSSEPAFRAECAARADRQCHAGLTSLQYDLRHYPESVQLAFWQAIAPDAYSIGPKSDGRAPLDARASLWELDRLLVTDFRSRAHFVRRPRAAIEARPGRFVKVRLYLDGESRLFEEQRSTRLGRDAIYVIDHSRPWNLNHGDHRTLNVFIPHEVIGYDPDRHPVVVSVSLRSPAGRLLRAALLALVSELPNAYGSDAPGISEGFAGLVRGVIGPGSGPRRTAEFTAGRDRAMHQFLERNLHDPDLGPAHLCRAFGASRATIYRAFEGLGGVGRYVLKRRLDRAFDELARDQGTWGIVKSTAERWHFASVSHFSNAFFERFGIRPTAAIGLTVAAPAARGPSCGGDLPAELVALCEDIKAMYSALIH